MDYLVKNMDEPPMHQAIVASQVEWDVRSRSLSNSTLELIVLPTEQCNFRCTYCYEDFSIGKMPQNIVDGVCALISRRSNSLQHLHINYFGGEPLLNLRAIRQISSHAKALHDQGKIELTSSITTNGYQLDEALLTELIALRCTEFQVSLDGSASYHNRTRPGRNGKPTFERIWNNLLAAKSSKHQFGMLIRVHLMPDNEDGVLELVDKINRELDDPRFEVFLKQVGNWGGNNRNHPDVYDDNSSQFDQFLSRVKGSLSRVANVDARESGGNASSSSPESPSIPTVCYAAKGNSLVVRANGRLSKCTVALNSEKNDVGSIRSDGTIQVDSQKLSLWMKGLATMDPEQLRCPATHVFSQ